jgi:tyrosyl-tRNA synthetase
VPRYDISRDELSAGIRALDLLTDKAPVFASKGEMRKLLQSGGISLNKEKLTDPETIINTASLVNAKYILAQKGRKNYFLLIAR